MSSIEERGIQVLGMTLRVWGPLPCPSCGEDAFFSLTQPPACHDPETQCRTCGARTVLGGINRRHPQWRLFTRVLREKIFASEGSAR